MVVKTKRNVGSNSSDLLLTDELKAIIAKYGAKIRTTPQKIEHAGITVSPNVYAVYEAAVFANYVCHFCAIQCQKGIGWESMDELVACMHQFFPLIHKDVDLPEITEEMTDRRFQVNNEAAQDYETCRDAILKFDTSIYSAALD